MLGRHVCRPVPQPLPAPVERAPTWKVAPPKAPPRRWWHRLFRRAEPTTFAKALAVHMHFAEHGGSGLR